MRTPRLGSGSSRRLTLLFLAVLVPPAITLVWLGVLLLEQDRNLWKQRDLERRQTVADAVVRSLDQMLSAAGRWPAGYPVPEGALRVVVSPGRTHTDPSGRTLWLPAPLPAQEADTPEFAAAEMLEFQGAPRQALVGYEELARSPGPSVRAGALLRIGRIYRRGGQTSEALRAYRDLAAMSGVATGDVPADLQARRAICAILDESGRKPDLAREAASLESDFLAGRWMLARPDWELAAGEIARWTGHALPVPLERKALAETAVRNHGVVADADKNNRIVCPLWTSNERRFQARHYVAWDRACSLCGRKVIVSDAIKRESDADPAIALVCDQCDLMDAPIELAVQSGPSPDEACATCAVLKQQEEAAAREAWRPHNLKDEQANAARRKLAHLAGARVRHLRKTHGHEQRGKH